MSSQKKQTGASEEVGLGIRLLVVTAVFAGFTLHEIKCSICSIGGRLRKRFKVRDKCQSR